MENIRTNEIKRIIEFFNRVEEASDKYNSGFATVGIYGEGDFFRDIFLTSERLCETDFFSEKMKYIKMIDCAIEKMAGAEWNTDKVIETLKNIQLEIVKFAFDGEEERIYSFRNNCMKYRERLELFESLYDKSYGEKQLEQQKIAELQERILELIQELESFSWDTEVKITIKRQLYAVRDSIERYNLFGKQALEKEINALLGGVMMEVSNAECVSDEEKRFLKKVTDFVKNANAAVKFVENIAMYAPALLEIL